MGKASFTPTKKKVLAMLKGRGEGGTKSSGIILTQVFEVLAMIRGGGAQSFQPLKGRGGGLSQTFLHCLEGRGCKQFQTRHFPIF